MATMRPWKSSTRLRFLHDFMQFFFSPALFWLDCISFVQANVISSSWSFLLSNSVWFKLLCCAWSDQLFTSAQTNGYVNTFHRLIMMNSWTHWKRDGEQRQIHRQYVNKAMRFEFPNLCIATSVAGVSAGTSGFSGASCDSWAVGMCFSNGKSREIWWPGSADLNHLETSNMRTLTNIWRSIRILVRSMFIPMIEICQQCSTKILWNTPFFLSKNRHLRAYTIFRHTQIIYIYIHIMYILCIFFFPNKFTQTLPNRGRFVSTFIGDFQAFRPPPAALGDLPDLHHLTDHGV